MQIEIIFEVILLGVALSMDAFAVSITDGLTYIDIDKKKSFFIAIVFGLMQALMPLIGFWLVQGITAIVGENGSASAGKIMSDIVSWTAFGLLLIIGGKMLIEGIKDIHKKEEEKEPKRFSIKEVLYFGVATSIDALGTGVALHSGLSSVSTIWLHVSIIMVITFSISLVGLFLGHRIEKLLKGKFEITAILGGSILILLAVWIILSHYFGI
ncbi:MAG: manganese efflux pump [Anaeroplasma sp.]|uniref:manganese efflux pump MntP n=1 Tax=Anaeroplasma sp. TaxID=1872523 RepID=UPI002A91AF8A|nr:manganese efflux pump [Anaeroplasma sp.]MDY5983582.1 manganese efflux pump [Anaeroplasma sp.]